MNAELTKLPDENEICQTIFSMDPDSTAGPNGFGGSFYRACWLIIKEDFVKVVCEFFRGHNIPKVWTSTLVVTIPKVEVPKTFGNYSQSIFVIFV